MARRGKKSRKISRQPVDAPMVPVILSGQWRFVRFFFRFTRGDKMAKKVAKKAAAKKAPAKKAPAKKAKKGCGCCCK